LIKNRVFLDELIGDGAHRSVLNAEVDKGAFKRGWRWRSRGRGNLFVWEKIPCQHTRIWARCKEFSTAIGNGQCIGYKVKHVNLHKEGWILVPNDFPGVVLDLAQVDAVFLVVEKATRRKGDAIEIAGKGGRELWRLQIGGCDMQCLISFQFHSELLIDKDANASHQTAGKLLSVACEDPKEGGGGDEIVTKAQTGRNV
jgi:hypothetical protein